MSKLLKKILVTGASLLMIASAGASISNINANASSGYYYVKHNYSYKDAAPDVPIGTRLHGPHTTSSEDSKLVSFEYGPVQGFIPWRDVGYHHKTHRVHHYYYRPVKRHRTRKLHRTKAHKARIHRLHHKLVKKALKRSRKSHKTRRYMTHRHARRSHHRY